MLRLLNIVLPLALLAGCQSNPPHHPLPGTAALPENGMVIGTLSYDSEHLAGMGRSDGVLRLERMDPPAARGESYLLGVELDGAHQRGYFAGTLPQGSYLIQEARLAGVALEPATLSMPFQVTRARVVDIGNRPYRAQTVSRLP